MGDFKVARPSKKLLWSGVAFVAVIAGYFLWTSVNSSDLPAGFARANGRIEATDLDISALEAGRIEQILVDEGDYVTAGKVLVQMDVLQLNAQKRQAEAELASAKINVASAESTLKQAQAEYRAYEAKVEQAKALAEVASLRRARSEELVLRNATSQQVLDDDRASDREAHAGVASAEAELAAAEATVNSARVGIINAEAAVVAAAAALESVQVSINDSTLEAPLDGRIQYRVAQIGEVVAAGGRILSLVDLSDVYMTVFLPTSEAGRVQIGSEVRLVMDAVPEIVIPARVSYIADVAQFTPKSIETADEREKLTFRVKAKVDRELLMKYIEYVKTGLPGMAYIQLDKNALWPESLKLVAQ
jgi:HlyD family secretion protein